MAQQAGNAGLQGGGGGVPLIRPAQIDGLPIVNAEAKARYKNGLAQLWQQLESNQPGSHEYTSIENKIRAASLQIMQNISKGNKPAPAVGGGGGGGQQSVNGQQRPQGTGGQANGMAQGMQQQQQQQQQSGSGQQQPQQAQQSQQQQQAGQMMPQTRQELGNIKINIPPQVAQQGEQAVSNYRRSWMNRAVQMLNRRDGARSRGSGLQKALQQAQQSGHGNVQQIQAEMEKCKTEMHNAHGEWEQFKASNVRNGQQQQQMSNGMNQQQQPSNQAQQQAQPGQDMSQRTPSAGGVSQSQQAQNQQQDVKMNMDQQQAGTAMSPTAQQGAFPQQQQQAAPSQAHSNMSHPQQTPQSTTQPSFPQQNNMSQQMNQQQQRPMNAQQMVQAQQSMAAQQQQQRQNTANQGMPQSAAQPQQPQQQAQSQQPPRPEPLTHQAAMSQASVARQDAAARQQQQQQQQQAQQQQPQMQQNVPHGLPLNTNLPPQSATNQTPTSSYPQMPTEHRGSTTKFPIAKELRLDPRTQGPVQGPPTRPTFSNAGMMGQPGVQRQAQFTLEGEGDRVLSKRKLDELVRQVTGTAAESGGLSPDVEEAVLTLADDFVDNVITSACRLAKLRNSQTLDMRDVQIVLERNYGIRIPGYSLDEVRTVRKFQPAEGWRSKMQAVQAGKVMSSGKDA